jgi:outer membrane receptor protein involved in Fe transport
MLKLSYLPLILFCLPFFASAQRNIRGKIYDGSSNHPIPGVSIESRVKSVHTITGADGSFSISLPDTDTLAVSVIGYKKKMVPVTNQSFLLIPMEAAFVNLNEVIVSGSRDLQLRKDIPAAIQLISSTTINETKATRLDMLVNKIPGVIMVDLGNEQHSMSIRQPLGYNSVYLYLQDGIPIRTIGDFNHNALIEINQAFMERIEVIKGPASSLYGSEAVGGAMNFISPTPSLQPTAKLQFESGSRGYKRSDIMLSNTYKKFGFVIGGYYANQHQPQDEHNDFQKLALSVKGDYHFSPATTWSTTVDYISYNTDQKGALDSLHFYSKDYKSVYRFTYRQVNALRLKSSLSHSWNAHHKTSATVYYRNSAIAQNPFYYISDVQGNQGKATGQINEDAFHSYGTVVQHVTGFNKLKAKWINGFTLDYSPATHYARFIDVDRDDKGTYFNYQSTDSLLTRYDVDLFNVGWYSQFELKLLPKVKLQAAARYDRFNYDFDNHLPPGAFSGAPDNRDHFAHFTPKLGVNIDLATYKGVYANYSVGFAPPNITELYTGVKLPTLKPSTYTNYESGGWFAFAENTGYAELSLYQMDGRNEIVSVRLADGTYLNENAGSTRHRGVEGSVKFNPVNELAIRIAASYAEHVYIQYNQQGKNYSGNKMPQAPSGIINSEVTFKPAKIKGFRASIEYQGVTKYFTDPANTHVYKGFHLLNFRIGQQVRCFELWMNCINLTNRLYATTVEKSEYGISYRPGQLRTFNFGVAYRFMKKHQPGVVRSAREESIM